MPSLLTRAWRKYRSFKTYDLTCMTHKGREIHDAWHSWHGIHDIHDTWRIKAWIVLSELSWYNLCLLISWHTHAVAEVGKCISSFHPSFVQHWECKSFFTVFYYVIFASVMWLFNEGLYLQLILSISVFSDKTRVRWFVLLGWGRFVKTTDNPSL